LTWGFFYGEARLHPFLGGKGLQKTPKAKALDSKKRLKLKLWTPKNT
jgi:hypothetical protein